MTPTFGTHARQLVARGWPALPVRGKCPDIAGRGWAQWNRELPPPAIIERWAREHGGANVGIPVPPNVVAIDVDVLDERQSAALAALADEVFGRTPLVRIGRAPKWLRVFRGSARHEKAHPIEVFCGAGQFVAFGQHPTTNQPYRWLDLDPTRIAPDDPRIPSVNQARVDLFLARAAGILGKPLARSANRERSNADAPGAWRDGLLGRAFDLAGLVRFRVADRAAVVCPWEDEHSEGAGSRTSTVIYGPGPGQEVGFLHCSHAHCDGQRQPADVLRMLPRAAVEQARRELGLDGSEGHGGASGRNRRDATEEDVEQEPEPWREPLPLDALHADASFPVSALPGWAARYVVELAVATQTPVDLAGMLTLAALAVATQRKFELRVGDDWREPLSLFTVIALPPGERKTAVVQRIAAPILAHERATQEELAPRLRDAEQQKRIAEQRLVALEKKAANAAPDDPVASEARDARLALEEIEVPERVVELADDVTMERLAQLLVRNGERIGVLSDEGGIFDTMGGRYSKSDAPSFELYLKGHAGSAHRVERVGRAPDYLRRPAITLGLAVQPAVLEGLASHPSFRGRGLLGRFLYAVPRSAVGSRDIAPPTVSGEAERAFDERLRALLAIPVSEEPSEIHLNAAAWHALLAFQERLEPRLGPSGDLASLADWAGKLTGALARIAGIRHLATYAGRTAPAAVAAEHVDAALSLADYLIAHARAALGAMGADPALADARKVVRAAAARAEERPAGSGRLAVTRAQLHAATKLERRKLDAGVALACDYGWLREAPREKGDGRPTTVYDVHPAAVRPKSDHPREKVVKGDKASAASDGDTFSTFSSFSPTSPPEGSAFRGAL